VAHITRFSINGNVINAQDFLAGGGARTEGFGIAFPQPVAGAAPYPAFTTGIFDNPPNGDDAYVASNTL
jgi:hypothetical protein